MKKDSLLQGDQFVISYELLHTLYWLLKYEEGELSKLISKSFVKGLKEKANNNDILTDMQITEEMQNSIVDFFNFMEQEISELTEQEATKLMNTAIIKDLDHVDPKQVDYTTVKKTISKRAEKQNRLTNSTQHRAHFLKELLRQWKPHKEKQKKLSIN